MENYKYLDLSKLEIDDNYLIELFELERIKYILNNIEFLDLSNNKLKKMPNLNKFQNIIYLNVSFNEIDESIDNNKIIELTCQYNKIKFIKSNSLKRLNASNNEISSIDIPNIEVLIINTNKIDWISSYTELTYLECIDNNLIKIDNMIELEELYLANNNITSIKNMPKLKLLNCVGNPINKINYFPNLIMLVTSIPNISSQYLISNISKIKSDYLINFKI